MVEVSFPQSRLAKVYFLRTKSLRFIPIKVRACKVYDPPSFFGTIDPTLVFLFSTLLPLRRLPYKITILRGLLLHVRVVGFEIAQ